MVSRVAPRPAHENARLDALRQYDILDTAAESVFDNIARLAANLLECPAAFVSFIDEDRQWIKASVGSDIQETTRDDGFCTHTILQSSVMVIDDARADIRFRANPYVCTDPGIRFYAGAAIVTSAGFGLGTVCVIDFVARPAESIQTEYLEVLAQIVMDELELRRTTHALLRAQRDLTELSQALPICPRCRAVRTDPEYWARVQAYVPSGIDHQLVEPCPNCRSEERARRVPGQTGEAATVLVVAETIEERAATGRMLGGGFTIWEAPSRDAALLLCVHGPPDCLIMDLSTPDEGMLQFLAIIRRLWPNLSIVGLDASGDESRLPATDISIGLLDHVISTPLEKDELRDLIRMALETRRQSD